MLFPDRLPPPPVIAGMMIPSGSQQATLQRIERYERPPPNLYALARDLFTAILRGQPYEWAVGQADNCADQVQREHARILLKTHQAYLRRRSGGWVGEGPTGHWAASDTLKLPLKCHALVDEAGEAVVTIFHFWQTPFPEDRVPLVKAAVRKAVWSLSGRTGAAIELVTAPLVPALGRRNSHLLRCDQGDIAEDVALADFGAKLANSWERYHELHPLRRWR